MDQERPAGVGLETTTMTTKNFSALSSFAFPSLQGSVLTLALVTAGCGGGLQARGATPRGAGKGWTEVATEHFVLKTDLDTADAQGAAVNLEAMFSALAELGFPSSDQPKMSVDVVYFRQHDDYARLRPDATAGQFFHGGMHDFERRPTAVLGGDFVQSTRRVLQHELTHLFVHYHYPKAPIWLNEGFARYLEGLVVEDGVAVLGRAPRQARFWKGAWSMTADGTDWRVRIPMGEAPTVSALREMSSDFYGDVNVDTTTSHGQGVMRTMAVHYQAAWCLVHLLLEDPAYSPSFADYLARVHQGDSDSAAWEATLGTLPQEKLEASFQASLAATEGTVLRTKFSPPPPAAPRVRAMEDREVRVLWARLRDWSNADARGAAAKEIENPSDGNVSVEAAAAQAFWEDASGDRAGADRVVRAALAESPSDPRLWNALGWILLGGAGGNSKESGEKLASVSSHLRKLAHTAAELDLLAHIAGRDGHLDDALRYEKEALAVDPSCGECLLFTADVLAAKGLFREAFATGTFALNPDVGIPPSVAATLEGWRRRAASARSPSPAPAVTPGIVPHADAVLAAMRVRFHACFGDGARPAPGGVEFDVRVDARGAVTSVEPRTGASFPPSVVDCLAGVLKAGHFPAPGAETTLSVPIRVNGS